MGAFWSKNHSQFNTGGDSKYPSRDVHYISNSDSKGSSTSVSATPCTEGGSYFQPLSWGVRMKVVLGAAKGLAFLHGVENQVICRESSLCQATIRDVKTCNILLDLKFNAKLCNFGLARDGPNGDKSHVSTRLMGTYGHDAPEHLSTGRLTSKSDVYSLGVVLLEILSGKQAIDKNRPKGERILVDWAKPCLNSRRKVLHILDPQLEGPYSLDQALQAANIAPQCLSTDSKSRPSMDNVVTALERLQSPNDEMKNDDYPDAQLNISNE